MGDPVNHTNQVDDIESETNGFLESTQGPAAAVDASPSEVMDASGEDDSALVESTDTAPEAQDRNQTSNLNGHLDSESLQQNGYSGSAEEEGSTGPSSAPPQEPTEEPWKKRLYFVRMPKFPEDNQYAIKVLQEEIDVYRSQVQLLNESMNVVRVRHLQSASLSGPFVQATSDVCLPEN